MASPHTTTSESPFGVKPSSSFFSKPIRVAPLNIATKQQQHKQPSLTASVKMMSPSPLNYASSPSSLSFSSAQQTPRPALSSQTFLEANVRLLCDMVDTILRTNESDQKMLRIDVSQPTTNLVQSSFNNNSCNSALEPPCSGDPKSPQYILSPKSFTQAKSDISKLDDGVVSKLNSDTLLDLFPAPPPLPQSPETAIVTRITAASSTTPHLAIPILERPTTIVVSPTTSWSCPSEDSGEVRPRKGSKQHRNWVISSGLFVSTWETAAAPATEDDYSHYKGGLHLPPGLSSPELPTTANTATAAAAAALPRPLVARRSLRQEKNHSSFSSTVGSLPAPLMTANLNTVSPLPINSSYNNSSSSIDMPCSAVTAMSPFSSMDALSQSLLNIETQMRRPSFLMNRRTSILSTLFATNSIALDQYDRQDQHQSSSTASSSTTDLFAFESAANVEPTSLFLGVPKERHESIGGPLDAMVHTSPEQVMDWRAWHGSWIRRRIKPEDDHNSVLSPTSPVPRTSYSSTRSFSLLSPTSPVPRSSYSSTRSSSSTCTSPNATLSPASTLVKRLSQRLRRPRMPSPISPTSSASSPLAAFVSSPLTPFYAPFAIPNTPTTPTKDANPELWENEGQKWGDRFQSLLSNFQPSSSSPPSSLPPPLPLISSSSSSNGKSSKKRWADILPKSRWNKWSSSSSSSARTSSESDRA